MDVGRYFQGSAGRGEGVIRSCRWRRLCSPIWQMYRNAPRVLSPTVNQTVDSLGAPDTAELPLTVNSGVLGAYQQFGSFDGNRTSVITSYEPYGTHLIASNGLPAMWLRFMHRAGPARDDAHWLSVDRLWGQHFAGGMLWYDVFFEQSGGSCNIVNPIDC